MRRRGRWLPLPAFSSSLSYYDGCVALAARPICCRAYATISVPHTYRRLDAEGSFHTRWGPDGKEVPIR